MYLFLVHESIVVKGVRPPPSGTTTGHQYISMLITMIKQTILNRSLKLNIYFKFVYKYHLLKKSHKHGLYGYQLLAIIVFSNS